MAWSCSALSMTLFSVAKSAPQGFHDQTEQSVCDGIGKQNPGKTQGIKTEQCDGASNLDKSDHRVSRSQRWRPGDEGIYCPAAGNEKARTCPYRNPIFHVTPPGFRLIVSPIPLNSKWDWQESGESVSIGVGYGFCPCYQAQFRCESRRDEGLMLLTPVS